MSARRGHGEGSIVKRADGRWEGRLDLGWDAGRRQRKSVYGRTRVEVVDKLRRAQTAHEHGQVLADERRTVGDYLQWWETVVLPGTVGVASAETYRRLLRLYVVPALGRKRLGRLAPGDVTEMMRGMQDRGLSSATQNAARKVLGRALRRAQQEGMLLRNVAQLSDPPKVTHSEGRAMTSAEVGRFVPALAGERLRVAYLTALVLGLRRGELLGLKWSDLDLEAAEATAEIRQQLQRRPGEGLVLTGLKTPKSRRTLAVPDQLRAELRGWKASQAEERLAAGASWKDPHGLVFTTPAGSPVDPDNFRRRLGVITKRAGLGHWRTHELRKSTGSLLFDQGVPMKLISETLGHSSERVTSDVYVRTRSTARSQVAAAIADAVWAAGEAL